MLTFMDYVQTAFHTSSGWNVDNSYASLTSTATHLLDFPLPQGVRLHISSLASPNFATSYTLGSKGVVDGSLSFLYSSLALKVASSNSRDIWLSHLVKGYRHLRQLKTPTPPLRDADDLGQFGDLLEGLRKEQKRQQKDTLLYGRLYLPSTTLEALYLRRISPYRLLSLRSVSDPALPNGGTLLALLQNDFGKYSTEYLLSTDSLLLGVRGLYNFGFDPRLPYDESQQQILSRPARHPWDHQNGRLSAGAEAYFSPINKSGGLSTGFRFTTLPVHTGFPYTMTLTLNPLMGNLSSSYAVKAGPNLALCSRFDFNVYSYESDVALGLELWRRNVPSPEALQSTAWARQMFREGWERPQRFGGEDDVTGVLKARVTDKGSVGVVWECRIKELLVSVGAGLELRRRERMLGRVGLEVSYST